MTQDDGTTGRDEKAEGTQRMSRFRPRLPSWAAQELRAHPGRLAAIILVAISAFAVSGLVAWSQRPEPVRAAPPSTQSPSQLPSSTGPPPYWTPPTVPSSSDGPSRPDPSEYETPGVSPSPTRTSQSATPRPKPTPKPTPKPSPTPEPTSTGDEEDVVEP